MTLGKHINKFMRISNLTERGPGDENDTTAATFSIQGQWTLMILVCWNKNASQFFPCWSQPVGKWAFSRNTEMG